MLVDRARKLYVHSTRRRGRVCVSVRSACAIGTHETEGKQSTKLRKKNHLKKLWTNEKSDSIAESS